MTPPETAAPAADAPSIAARLPFAVAIFLGAFLLFQVQPLVGKFIIPWYGGLPAAWTACMIFFQGGLLGGYLYAHLLCRLASPLQQAIVHTALLAASLLLLPIAPGAEWKPEPGTHSMDGIFLLLGISVGLPYLLLASTGPLTQAWFFRVFPSSAPYRLFALSNLGSMLALVTYPFLFEPWFTRITQGWIWSLAFGVFAVTCVACAFLARTGSEVADVDAAGVGFDAAAAPPTPVSYALWLALPACASLLLLAVTNQLTQGMPSIPFLWLLPLSVYLLTFIVCFEWPRAYVRVAFLVAMAVSLGIACYLLRTNNQATAIQQIVGYSIALFVCCMACHGELALSKPDPRHLTGFYLAIAAGGAIGGGFVGLVAPRIFDGLWELHLGLFLTPILVLVSQFRDDASPLHHGRPQWAWLLLAASIATLGFDLKQRHTESLTFSVASSRDFFGVLKLFEAPSVNPTGQVRLLGHGGIIHGFQWFEPDERRHLITSYFGPGTGVAEVFRLLDARRPIRAGVVGLGIGTIAAWGQEGDHFLFYEINPGVVRMAQENFSYLGDSAAEIEIIEGDGRLALEAAPDQEFDILVLDAFNGDSPPIHLITAEAFLVYKRHLRPDGVLAVNISNKYLDFEAVVRRLAEEIGLHAIRVDSDYDFSAGITAATWMLLTRDAGFFEPLADRISTPSEVSEALWTDDYANVLSTLR